MEVSMLELVGKRSEPTAFEYTWKDVVLYALSVGAQTDELSFIYENAPGGLKAVPSFCVIPTFEPLSTLVLGLQIDLTRVLHGEHCIRLHGPIPTEGKLKTAAEVTNVYDKGKAALICARMETTLEGGEPLFENEVVIYYRGAGGFGGDPGPRAERLDPPEGVDPDFGVSYPIPENQAALYRLNVDPNPLHIDPNFAKMAGFDKPILHGLCSFGYAVRAILSSVCDGDVARFKEFRARFSNVVFPGETLVTEGWRDREGRYLIRVRTDRAVVMNRSYVVVEQ
jgi:acyl dehydratase